ncbi:MAG: hypothetical protein KC933_38515, partial [Myxococcales bacterium]|nr:hypothetical protein [Myxococcales bacterium]
TEPVRVLSEGPGAATLLLTRTPRGAWKRTRVASGSPPVVRTSARGAWVFTLEGTTVLGRALTGSGRLRVRDAIAFEAALDPRGRPAVATLGARTNAITLVDGARRGALRLPPDVHAAPEACLKAPCEVVAHTAELDAVVATARGAAALYTQATTTGAQTCRPFDGPWHPCDPAGPRNTCPSRPKYSCSAKEEVARDPRVAWLARGALRHASLAPLLGWSQADLRSSDAWQVMGAVLGAAADPQGNLHLVVREPASRGAAVRWLRLVPADTPVGERTVADVAPWSSAFDVVPTSEDALAFAGVARQHWVGAVRFGPEGAEASGGQWSAALDGLDPEQAAQATVELTFPAAPDPSSPVCGAPAIQLFHQGRGAAVYLEAAGMTLVDRYAEASQRLSVPLAGRHRLELRVGRAAAEARVDGASVGRVTFSGPARSVANERLWVGHTSLCMTPSPPLVWHRLAVTSTAAAPGAASARSAPPAPR